MYSARLISMGRFVRSAGRPITKVIDDDTKINLICDNILHF